MKNYEERKKVWWVCIGQHKKWSSPILLSVAPDIRELIQFNIFLVAKKKRKIENIWFGCELHFVLQSARGGA